MSETKKSALTIVPNEDYAVLELTIPELPGGLVMASPMGSAENLRPKFGRFQIIAIGPGAVNFGVRVPPIYQKGDFVCPPAPIPTVPDPKTNEPRFRMPCDWVQVGEPEAAGRKLFVIHARDILYKIDGEFEQEFVRENSDILLAKPVDSRIRKAAQKVLAH